MSDYLTLKFGKHKSKSLDEVAGEDPQYLTFLMTTKILKPEQRTYILKNLIDEMEIGWGKNKLSKYSTIKELDSKYLEWASKNTKHTWLTEYLSL